MFQNNQILIYDGAMGTMLRAGKFQPGEIPDLYAITKPQSVADVHQGYLDAGANILCTNTFGSNRYRLAESGYHVDQVISAAVAIAKNVAKDKALVSLDIGPTGAQLAPMGAVTFDQVYEAFAEVAVAGEKAGADCVSIETMYNMTELRAAILAVKEHTSLPILATMTFDPDGKTFLGVTCESFAMTAEGLGVTALGVNCSTGPADLLETVKRISKVTTLPLIVKPNAGFPDEETGKYSLKPAEFADFMTEFLEYGAALVGGCCGTNPAYIAALASAMKGKTLHKNKACQIPYACSPAQFVPLDDHVLLSTALLTEAGYEDAVAADDGDAILDWIEADIAEGANLICLPILEGHLENCIHIVQHIQEFVYEPLVFVAKTPDSLDKILQEYQGKACVLADDSADLESLSVPIMKYGAILMGH